MGFLRRPGTPTVGRDLSRLLHTPWTEVPGLLSADRGLADPATLVRLNETHRGGWRPPPGCPPALDLYLMVAVAIEGAPGVLTAYARLGALRAVMPAPVEGREAPELAELRKDVLVACDDAERWPGSGGNRITLLSLVRSGATDGTDDARTDDGSEVYRRALRPIPGARPADPAERRRAETLLAANLATRSRRKEPPARRADLREAIALQLAIDRKFWLEGSRELVGTWCALLAETGDDLSVDETLLLIAEATALHSRTCSRRPDAMDVAGGALLRAVRYRCTEDPSDFAAAEAMIDDALRLVGGDTAGRMHVMNTADEVYRIRHLVSGSAEDLRRALTCREAALALQPLRLGIADAEAAQMADRWAELYEATGEEPALRRAIQLAGLSLETCLPAHTRPRSGHQRRLAMLLRSLFHLTGDREPIEQAVALAEQATGLAAGVDDVALGRMTLALVLLARDRGEDRDRALTLGRQAVEDPPRSEGGALLVRVDLASLLTAMAEHRNRIDRPADAAALAAEAIASLRTELPTVPPRGRPAVLINLGGALLEHHVATGAHGGSARPDDLDEAIGHLEEAATMRLRGGDRAEAETWLARALAERTGWRSHPDLDRARALAASALRLTPAAHPRRREREELAARLDATSAG